MHSCGPCASVYPHIAYPFIIRCFGAPFAELLHGRFRASEAMVGSSNASRRPMPAQPSKLLLTSAFLLGLLLAYTLVSDWLSTRSARAGRVVTSASAQPSAFHSRRSGYPAAQRKSEWASGASRKAVGSPVHGGAPSSNAVQLMVKRDESETPSPYASLDNERTRGESACNPEEHADLAGELVLTGMQNKQPSAAACCQSCKEYNANAVGQRPCNVWVWCPSEHGCDNQPMHSCWLKWQPRPEAAFGMRTERKRWVGGHLGPPNSLPTSRANKNEAKKLFHTAVTANAQTYVQWQARVMYYWFKVWKAQQGDDGEMGGFTRVLHDKPDNFMEEIPTCVVDRLSNEHGFVVMSRPQAIQQWLDKCEVEEDYILMAEPDHLILRPMPNPMHGDTPAAFPFFYINPYKFPEIVRSFVGDVSQQQLERMDPIGNSPVFIRKTDLKAIAPTWANVTLQVKNNPESDKAWGWVQEMYAYSMASFLHNVSHSLHLQLMAQPPWDTSLKKTFILHYTYGCDYTLDGKFMPGRFGEWRFDKRSYSVRPPPRNLLPPPDGVPETITTLVQMINTATQELPDWDEWVSSFR